MSARAAWRLETLGCRQVYRYTAGKLDWLAMGLPSEGESKDSERVGAVARRDLPTCRLTDRVGEVRELVQAASWNACAVVTDDQIVLGMLRQQALQSDPQATAEDVMADGPSTFRPSVSIKEMVDYLGKQDLKTALITTSDGRLVGLFFREEGERRLQETGTAGTKAS